MSVPVFSGPDRLRPMPCSTAARLDDIASALAALRRERSRFERLGFERPQARCHAELRFWGFLSALHSLPGDAGSPSARDGGS